MSALPDAPESSRAREAAEAEARPQRQWVVLSSIPVGGPGSRSMDERVQYVARGTDFLIDLHDPPLPSTLVLRANLTQLYPVIYIADSSAALLLLRASMGSSPIPRPEFFLCDARARTATRLPAVPSANLGGLDLRLRRNIGLLDRRGHLIVTQLHPFGATRFESLLCYSTATRQWSVKTLASAPEHKPWGVHGVFAHDELLWWVDIAYGMLYCDPFSETPRLRFVGLPDGCGLQGLDQDNFTANTRHFFDERRCIRLSEGKLRYVEIRGFCYDTDAAAAEPPNNPSVWMWTLVDPDAADPWRLEYDVPFADIWADESYITAWLPPGKVPHVALVDPNDHGVVYFFQESLLFGLDVRAKRVVACDQCLIDNDAKQRFQSSRFVDAWEPPQRKRPRPGDAPSSGGNEGRPTVLTYDEEKDREVIEYVQNWLSEMDLTSQQMSDEDMAPPSEPSSPDAGQQADDEP